MTIAQEGDAPEAAQVAPPRVRMDKSRAFSTIHGERGPGDRHAGVHFMQDGIPADASGHFLFDHPDMNEPGPEGDKRRRAAEKKIKRAMAQQAKAPQRKRPDPAEGDDADLDEEATVDLDDEDDEDELEPINLEAWLRGEQEVEWQEVTQEIARRYKKRITKIEDAVAFLVKEGVVPKAQLKRRFQKYAD